MTKKQHSTHSIRKQEKHDKNTQHRQSTARTTSIVLLLISVLFVLSACIQEPLPADNAEARTEQQEQHQDQVVQVTQEETNNERDTATEQTQDVTTIDDQNTQEQAEQENTQRTSIEELQKEIEELEKALGTNNEANSKQDTTNNDTTNTATTNDTNSSNSNDELLLYVVEERDEQLTIYNENYEQEDIVLLQSDAKSLLLHQDYGYVLNQGSNSFTMFEMTNGSYVSKNIKTQTYPKNLFLHNNKIHILLDPAGFEVFALDGTREEYQRVDIEAEKAISIDDDTVGLLLEQEAAFVFYNLEDERIEEKIMLEEQVRYAYLHTNGKIYLSSQRDNNIYVIDADSQSQEATITLPAGTIVQEIQFKPNTRTMYIAGKTSGDVLVFDEAIKKIEDTITVRGSADSIAFNNDGSVAYVANYARNEINVINTNTNALIKRVQIGKGPNVIRTQ